MKRLRLALLVPLLALMASVASADVTVKLTVSISGSPVGGVDMPMVSYVKGMKMRADMQAMNQDISILVDLVAKQRLMIDHVAKQVGDFDPQAAMAAMPVTFGEVTTSVKPNGQTKQVLGRDCAGYDVTVTMPLTMGGEMVTMIMSGPAWIAKDGLGVSEYMAFQKAATAAGLLTSPLAQGPQGKGMMEMQKALGEAGVALLQNLQMRVEGTGQMAEAMGQMAMTIAMVVTEISTDPIPDDKFVVPAGYTKK